jgi:hypothetical protein
VTEVCSCYDDDCKDVKDPLQCWFGDSTTGIADGACPLLRAPRPKVEIWSTPSGSSFFFKAYNEHIAKLKGAS